MNINELTASDDFFLTSLLTAYRKTSKEANSLDGFLSQYSRIVQRSNPEEPSARLSVFWNSLLQIAQTALHTESRAEGKWLLRSRTVRPISQQEMDTRIRLMAVRCYQSALAARGPSPATMGTGSDEPRLIDLAIEFSNLLQMTPSILTNVSREEILSLHAVAEIHSKAKELS